MICWVFLPQTTGWTSIQSVKWSLQLWLSKFSSVWSSLQDTIKIAKKTKKIVFENIVFSIVIKVVLMVLGFLGFVPLWLAVFGDVGVMLLAIINSLRVKKY